MQFVKMGYISSSSLFVCVGTHGFSPHSPIAKRMLFSPSRENSPLLALCDLEFRKAFLILIHWEEEAGGAVNDIVMLKDLTMWDFVTKVWDAVGKDFINKEDPKQSTCKVAESSFSLVSMASSKLHSQSLFFLVVILLRGTQKTACWDVAKSLIQRKKYHWTDERNFDRHDPMYGSLMGRLMILPFVWVLQSGAVVSILIDQQYRIGTLEVFLMVEGYCHLLVERNEDHPYSTRGVSFIIPL
ncbi:hypothetical protein RHGRI_001026 [Rhododendron griersonianum]|uniref:Uncharacterized protein n=1 Tax=Rhododendron griersonianum TaxID=479676 RepID=A0AAV6LJX5_9ERIC|nr:hypothetical protein RHGRI_001026 [Rhododendron griersonianum]